LFQAVPCGNNLFSKLVALYRYLYCTSMHSSSIRYTEQPWTAMTSAFFVAQVFHPFQVVCNTQIDLSHF